MILSSWWKQVCFDLKSRGIERERNRDKQHVREAVHKGAFVGLSLLRIQLEPKWRKRLGLYKTGGFLRQIQNIF